jgi:hypothetical protein
VTLSQTKPHASPEKRQTDVSPLVKWGVKQHLGLSLLLLVSISITLLNCVLPAEAAAAKVGGDSLLDGKTCFQMWDSPGTNKNNL